MGTPRAAVPHVVTECLSTALEGNEMSVIRVGRMARHGGAQTTGGGGDACGVGKKRDTDDRAVTGHNSRPGFSQVR